MATEETTAKPAKPVVAPKAAAKKEPVAVEKADTKPPAKPEFADLVKSGRTAFQNAKRLKAEQEAKQNK